MPRSEVVRGMVYCAASQLATGPLRRIDRGTTMRVLITGGTGFVGYHSARALLDAGHEVKLLVRSADKMRGLYGARALDHVVGDVTDEAAVERALEGCDAVIHSAAMVSTNARDAGRVYETNVQGTRLVVGGAARLGLRTVHVSSVTALYDPRADALDEHAPLGTAESAYGRSKLASEHFVRELQEQGAPVYITHPAGIIGPDSPTLTEPHQGLVIYLGRVIPISVSGTQFVDVRDVALAHRLLLESDAAPGRYPLGGHYIEWRDLVRRIEQLTGLNKLTYPIPAPLLRLIGRLADLLRHAITIEAPVSHEGSVYATDWKILDNAKLERTLDFRFRDLDTTLADSLRWLARAGHVEPGRLGRLIPAPVAADGASLSES